MSYSILELTNRTAFLKEHLIWDFPIDLGQPITRQSSWLSDTMPSLPLDTFSSEDEFRVYTKTYSLVPGFV
ncbi:hypothetical protein EAE99_010068 [Botrytis elliptica]|nr:hypothetical protein EAE99_010068 [Botrytis elliptica]